MAKPTKEYLNLKLENMMEYINEKFKDSPKELEQAKKEFKANALSCKPKKVSKKVYTDDGTPVMIVVKDSETGKPKLNSKGEIMKRQKIEYVTTGEYNETATFDLNKAKRYFCETYKPELLPKKEKEVITATDKLNNW